MPRLPAYMRCESTPAEIERDRYWSDLVDRHEVEDPALRDDAASTTCSVATLVDAYEEPYLDDLRADEEENCVVAEDVSAVFEDHDDHWSNEALIAGGGARDPDHADWGSNEDNDDWDDDDDDDDDHDSDDARDNDIGAEVVSAADGGGEGGGGGSPQLRRRQRRVKANLLTLALLWDRRKRDPLLDEMGACPHICTRAVEDAL